MLIKNIRSIKEHVEGTIDWGWLNGYAGADGEGRVVDIDGAVERFRHGLWFECKPPGWTMWDDGGRGQKELYQLIANTKHHAVVILTGHNRVNARCQTCQNPPRSGLRAAHHALVGPRAVAPAAPRDTRRRTGVRARVGPHRDKHRLGPLHAAAPVPRVPRARLAAVHEAPGDLTGRVSRGLASGRI